MSVSLFAAGRIDVNRLVEAYRDAFGALGGAEPTIRGYNQFHLYNAAGTLGVLDLQEQCEKFIATHMVRSPRFARCLMFVYRMIGRNGTRVIWSIWSIWSMPRLPRLPRLHAAPPPIYPYYVLIVPESIASASSFSRASVSVRVLRRPGPTSLLTSALSL